jgi:hypothetical protein
MVNCGRIVLFVMLALHPVVTAQSEQHSVVPVVQGGEMPVYPSGALSARLQGTVRMEVWTDGTGVLAIQGEQTDVHKSLTFAAKRNVLTWRFEPHSPTNFHVVFSYRLEEGGPDSSGNSTVHMELPYRVEISARVRNP